MRMQIEILDKFIQKNNNTSSVIKNASYKKDDEFFTPTFVAENFLRPCLKYLKNKKVICPCDDANSEIYKFLKNNNIDVNCSSHMETVNYQNYDVVITNHPWSKSKLFFNLIKNKKYIILWSNIALFNVYVEPPFHSRDYATNEWGRPNGVEKKRVAYRFYSNIKDFWEFTRKDGEIEFFREYSIGAWNLRQCKSNNWVYTQTQEFRKKWESLGYSLPFAKIVFLPQGVERKYKIIQIFEDGRWYWGNDKQKKIQANKIKLLFKINVFN